ncbi:hypothetical protein [Mumia quercus]|uniref:hypothetical protein n=1 Tax=Mumia quercus TaxID=2976125 RepID=UPI0021D1029D|nr:hypothetical protein [Mumia quercus]
MTPLPYIDEHVEVVAAPRSVVWAALEDYAASDLARGVGTVGSFLLGTKPRGGFAVRERTPGERLVLGGRHRFSRYRLEFALADTPRGATSLRAASFAEFPGPHGAAYRALVIRSGLHVVATTRMLRQISRRATSASRP